MGELMIKNNSRVASAHGKLIHVMHGYTQLLQN